MQSCGVSCGTEIKQFHFTVICYKDVIRCYISVNYSGFMYIFKRVKHRQSISYGLLIRNFSLSFKIDFKVRPSRYSIIIYAVPFPQSCHKY